MLQRMLQQCASQPAHQLLTLGTTTLTGDGTTCRVAVNATTTVAGSGILAQVEVQQCSSHMAALGGAVGSLAIPRRTRQTATLPAGTIRSAVAKAPRPPPQHNALQ